MRSKIAAVAFAILLVTAGIPSGPVGTATATHDCGEVDRLILMATFTHVNADKCMDNHVAHVIENMSQNDADQVRSDTYQGALEQQSFSETWFTTADNNLKRTDGSTWMEVEIALAEGYESGNITSTGGAEAVAGEAVQDTYSTTAINHIEKWNTTLAAAERMENVTDSEANVSDNFHNVTYQGEVYNDGRHMIEIREFGTTTVTLPNDTQHTARAVKIWHGYDASNDGSANAQSSHWVGPTTGEVQSNPDSSTYTSDSLAYIRGLQVHGPTADDDTVQYLHFDNYASRYSDINNQSSSLHSEATTFGNETYSAFDSGKVNSTDLINRNTAMFRLAADEVSGENTLYRSTAGLAMLGLEVPTLNGTGTMEVEYGGVTYEGMLLAESAPGGQWDANTTYDAGNITGPVMMVTTSGEKLDLSGQFSTGTITNEAGDPISNVTHERIVYKTANASETNEKMLELLEYRQEVENREPTVGGGGSGGFDFSDFSIGGIPGVGVLAIVIGGALILLKD